MKSKFRVFILFFVTLMLLISNCTVHAASPYQSFVANHTTALSKGTEGAVYRMGDFNNDGILDLYYILPDARGATEVHILNGADNYDSFLLQIRTPLGVTSDNYDFDLGDYNRDGKIDLYAIAKKGAYNTTEIHVLDGANNYQSFLLHVGTILNQTDENWTFRVGDYDLDGTLDLYAIAKKGAYNTTEIHVISGAGNFQNFLLHVGTALHQTDEDWDFDLADYDGDGRLDLYGIAKKGGSNSTEIHVLGYTGNFKSFILQTSTILHKTNSDWQFQISKSNKDFYAINRAGGTGSEIHVLGSGISSQTNGSKIAAQALSKNGYPYVYGATGPNAFDCSGLTQWAHRQIGISIGRTVTTQLADGTSIFQNNLQLGDLVFYTTDGSGSASHVGIYIGSGQFIHAGTASTGVYIADMNLSYWSSRYKGARRYW